MATILFSIILFIYIGLGIPDSSLGSAWPAIFADLNLEVGLNSLISFLISSGTICASIFSSKLINKFGTQLVTACSTLLASLSLLGFAFSNSIWFFCSLSIPLGLAAGAIDAALNNYVVCRYSSTHVNFLHCFYGIGVAITPYIFSFTLKNSNDWRSGYEIIFLIELALAILCFASLPLWKKVKQKNSDKEVAPVTLTIPQMLKTPAFKSNCLAFFCTCALEFTVGTWGCTYLVKSLNLLESVAAKYLTLYYLGITGSRLISSVISRKLSSGKIISGGCMIIAIGLAILFLPISPQFKGLSMLLIGLGNGPTFPNLIHQTPHNFGMEKSQSLIGLEMAMCNVGILVAPPLFGVLVQLISTDIFPYFTTLCFLLMAVCLVVHQKGLKKFNKSLFIKY